MYNDQTCSFNRQTAYDYCIGFLKALLAFYVIVCHFWIPSGSQTSLIVHRQRMAAVPVFFMISFYLTHRMYQKADIDKLKKRMWRLVYPFIAWGVLYYAIYSLLYWIVGEERPFSPQDLLWQLTLGSDRYLCPQMWYQFDLIVFTIVFFCICGFFRENCKQIIVFLAVISIIIQYSGINASVFGKMEYEMIFPLGRLAECFPIAVMGYIIADYNLLERVKNHRLFVFLISFIMLITMGRYGLFSYSEGFLYGGTQVYIYGLLTFLLFYSIPFDRLPQFFKKSIEFLAKYSFGVFCLHYGVGTWFNILLSHFSLPINTVVECICVYAVSVFFSWLISMIPSKFSKQLVE